MVTMVSSGVILDVPGTTVEDVRVGGTVRVTNDGVVSGGQVLSRGYIAVSSGTALDITVSAIGRMDVAIGGGAAVVSGLNVVGAGTVSLWQNGSSVSGVISAGGTMYAGRKSTASKGGTSIGDTVANGGTLFVENAGIATDTVISAGGRTIIDAQGIATGASIYSGGTAIVSSGGTLYEAVVRSGGILSNFGAGSGSVDSRGLTSATQVQSGGTMIIGSGGIGYNETAEDGGSILVNAYGSAYVSNFEAGNYTVTSVGRVFVQDNGVLSNVNVLSYGLVSVSGAGATLRNAYISGAQALIQVASGGVISATRVDSMGVVTLASGGTSISGVISAGGTINAGVKYGGTTSCGVSISDTVLSRGVLYVQNSGSALNTIISAGGRTIIGTSGVSTSAAVLAGGSASVESGGTAISAVVSAGGILTNAGLAPDYPSTTDSRGVTSGTHVLSGGTAMINSGGVSYNDTADSGGSLSVNAWGSAYISQFSASNYDITSQGRVFVQEGGVLSGVDMTTYAQLSVSGSGALVKEVHLSGAQGNINASAGGVISSARIEGYGSINLFSGGTSVSGVVGAGGTLFAGQRNTGMSAGLAVSDTVLKGGAIFVENYGSAFKPVISSGGRLSATTNGSVTSAIVLNGGTMYVGISNNTTGPASSFNTYISSGGTEIIGSGGVETGAIVGSGGTVQLNTPGALVSGYLEEHGTIDFNYLSGTITSANLTSDGLLTVRASNGRTASIQLAGTYKHNEFAFSGDTLTLLCFLAGTHIRTPDGEVLVEDLRIGDIVSVWDWKAGIETTRKLRWVGRHPIKVDPDLPDDEAGYPVRFLANCIAPNLPERDLLVTPEHCLFFDGKFVPARMLVNGVSIYYDKTITGAYAYHIETEDGHSILWAESALSESYLDTGNRRQFFQHGPLVQFGRDRVYDWAKDAAAPLDVSRATVEPLYERFAQRAVLRAPQRATTFDKALALKTSDGKVFRPVRVKDARHVFLIEGDVASLTLVSNASRPSDVIGPFVDDRRRLGVLVDGISVFGNTGMRAFTMHLQSGSLFGWLPLEAGQVGRWTQGEALLPLHLKADNGPHLIAINVIAGGPYLVPVASEKPAQIMSVEEKEPALALSP